MKTNNFPKMHVSLYVKDIEATVNFYNKFFAQEAEKVKPGYAKYMLAEPALVISFVQAADKVQANFGHLGFQVESKEVLEQRLELAHSKGLKTLEEIGTNCCYALQDKYWVADPDGHQWEVYYFTADSEFNDPQYEMKGEEACCTPEAKQEQALIEEVEVASCCEPGGGCC